MVRGRRRARPGYSATSSGSGSRGGKCRSRISAHSWRTTKPVVSACAWTSLDVHPNTFRYRLRRAAEITGIDLNDPEKRFAAMLELRIMRADSP
ncbi:helix-turn-helix domain-containing protein [Streptomyces sp. NPDC127074]|uniref:helix-turn-helix domain-containing protein n=1 Tax=Streptomyces sp. NPDC127074 TaxID=3347130 RepID=UPI0036614595